MLIRPMLAAQLEDLSQVRFPVIASPKIDGIRCLTVDEVPDPGKNSVAMSRSMKTIPNLSIRRTVELAPPGLDGELEVLAKGDFGTQTSGIMQVHGSPDFAYRVFDYVHTEMGYLSRLEHVTKVINELDIPQIKLHPYHSCHSVNDLQDYYQYCLNDGYEGVCFRLPHSPYKFGRSTFRQQWLVKMKQFEDSEAIVLQVTELQHNDNAPKQSELDYQVRTSHQANMRPGNKLGALVVRDIKTGSQFSVGTGFTDQQRINMWDARPTLIGKIIKYRHQPHGAKNAPRIPTFLGFRDTADLS